MACRCPVLASDIPGCRDLITSGVNGRLCPPGDVEGFAAALLELLDDREITASYAEVARRQVLQQHEIGQVVGRWVGLYGLAVQG